MHKGCLWHSSLGVVVMMMVMLVVMVMVVMVVMMVVMVVVVIQIQTKPFEPPHPHAPTPHLIEFMPMMMQSLFLPSPTKALAMALMSSAT